MARRLSDARLRTPVPALNDHFGGLGLPIIGIFAASWLVSTAIYRLKKYDEIEAA